MASEQSRKSDLTSDLKYVKSISCGQLTCFLEELLGHDFVAGDLAGLDRHWHGAGSADATGLSVHPLVDVAELKMV